MFEKDPPGTLTGARWSITSHGQGVRQQDVHHDVGGPTGADEGCGSLFVRPNTEPTEMLNDRRRWRGLPYQRGEGLPGASALPAGDGTITGREALERGRA